MLKYMLRKVRKSLKKNRKMNKISETKVITYFIIKKIMNEFGIMVKSVWLERLLFAIKENLTTMD